MKTKLLLLFVLTLLLALMPVKQAQAETLTDWVIRDFSSEIRVDQDSSLRITEKIVADCGSLQNKHGIFRTIPYQTYGLNNKEFKTPIDLISISDFSGKQYKHETIRDSKNHTITWKIGDANTEVSGINNYLIEYRVLNAVRKDDPNFDELYWNLNGNFWEIPIENYQAKVVFPEGLNLSKAETTLYAGSFGANSTDVATSSWLGQELMVKALLPLKKGEGITFSVTMPKNFFATYSAPFTERAEFFAILPLLILMICFLLWKKFGRDPHTLEGNWSIAPEFEIPEKLPPLELGMVKTDGTLKNTFLTAAIINLAVKKHLKIHDVGKTGLMQQTDFKIERLVVNAKGLSESESLLLNRLFNGQPSVLMSDLKNKFYKDIPAIENKAMDFLESKDWVFRSSKSWMIAFLSIGFVFLFGSLMLFDYENLIVSVFVSGLIILIFAPLMRRRTIEGLLILRKIKGFELYIKKAEKYRQQWLEKQNIFEEFLPYAILFGVAKDWMRKMQNIYGAEYFAAYHPLWYMGAAGNFDFNQFSNSIDSLSNNIGATLSSNPSSSGTGGGGFSGGGGGGGGGGGW